MINKDRLSDNKTGILVHIVIPGVMLVLVIFAGFMIIRWNHGQKSDYDPMDNGTEFDTEPNDYILPLSAKDVEGKNADDVLTVLTLGNSPFADDYEYNMLASSIADIYNANVINGGIEDSYISCRNKEYSDDYVMDGISLPYIARALATGEYTVPDTAAIHVSEQAVEAVERLKAVDMNTVDGIFIMYDLEDYVDHRPLGSESISDITSIYGAVRSSIEALRQAYPHIRIVYISQPACGKTIDDFYVDGDIHNIGEGLLSDYVNFELEATASAGASFIDIYYGVINVDTKDLYLENDYHINAAGAEAIAKRLYKLISVQP